MPHFLKSIWRVERWGQERSWDCGSAGVPTDGDHQKRGVSELQHMCENSLQRRRIRERWPQILIWEENDRESTVFCGLKDHKHTHSHTQPQVYVTETPLLSLPPSLCPSLTPAPTPSPCDFYCPVVFGDWRQRPQQTMGSIYRKCVRLRLTWTDICAVINTVLRFFHLTTDCGGDLYMCRTHKRTLKHMYESVRGALNEGQDDEIPAKAVFHFLTVHLGLYHCCLISMLSSRRWRNTFEKYILCIGYYSRYGGFLCELFLVLFFGQNQIYFCSTPEELLQQMVRGNETDGN